MPEKTETLTPEQALLGLDALEKWCKAEKEKIKHKVQDQMLADYEANGVEKRAVKHPVTGERIASWIVPVPKPGPKVTDEQAFIEWAVLNAAEVLETRIRTSALSGLVKDLPKGEDGEVYDPETGEAIPGLRIMTGTPTYIRSQYDGGRQRQEQIVREALEGRFPLALEAGETR